MDTFEIAMEQANELIRLNELFDSIIATESTIMEASLASNNAVTTDQTTFKEKQVKSANFFTKLFTTLSNIVKSILKSIADTISKVRDRKEPGQSTIEVRVDNVANDCYAEINEGTTLVSSIITANEEQLPGIVEKVNAWSSKVDTFLGQGFQNHLKSARLFDQNAKLSMIQRSKPRLNDINYLFDRNVSQITNFINNPGMNEQNMGSYNTKKKSLTQISQTSRKLVSRLS